MDSTSMNTDSLSEVGFLGALALADNVCRMAAMIIASEDIVSWLRSHTATEI